MAARLDSVAKYICEKGAWKVSNLQLQKLMYMSQMIYMGRHDGARLIDAEFQAWDYGPVIPELYKRVRMFGAGYIRDVFFAARPFKPDDHRRETLDYVADGLLHLRPGELVDITHWKHGAWASNYVSGIRSITIPDRDIAAEYHRRISEAARRADPALAG